jgi:DNA-binding response OmpR family regulator
VRLADRAISAVRFFGGPVTPNTNPKPTILVVDDDVAIRLWIQEVLFEHGYDPVLVANASQGLSVFQMDNLAIDLAIVDMMLPGATGLDLAAELDRQRPGLRILYISGRVDSIAMEAIALKSPEQVLLKPFTEESLIARIHTLIGKPPCSQHAKAGGVSNPE